MSRPDDPSIEVLHASCVANAAGAALLIIGASGSGKSTLALQLLALGNRLVADDRTEVTYSNATDQLTARCPDVIRNQIEVRGVGILAVDAVTQSNVVAIVDMDHVETDRLPTPRFRDVNGKKVTCFHKVEGPHFAAALHLWLAGGRIA